VYIPHIVVAIAAGIIFVVSAYRAISSLNGSGFILDFLFNASVATVALAYLVN
jgi:hypothetical protein